MTNRISREAGFTLLELLLVLGVAAIVFLGIVQITRSWVDSESSSAAGQHLARISTITQKYIEGKFNVLTPTDDAIADGANPTSPWADLRTTFQQAGLLDNTNSLKSPFNVPMHISFVKDVSVNPNIYRAAIFTTQNLPNKRVLDAAREAGNTGGTVTVMPTSPNVANDAIGAFGQWKILANNLLPSNLFPCPRTKTRGCLVSVISYNQDTLCGPYLYRDTIPGCADANTMNTTLNMNSHDVTSAGTVTTNDLDVTNNASLGQTTVNGTSTFNGPTTASRGLTVNHGMTVDGDADFSNNVTMNNGGSMNVATLNANKVQANKVVTNNLNSQNMNVTGNMTTDSSLTVNGDVTVNGAGNAVFAGTVNAGAINANNGAVNVSSMTVQNTMNINGAVNINGNHNLVVDRLIVDHCAKIDNNPYGNCP